MDDTVKNEFLFYSRLAKRLVVNLSESSDRILAVAWIRKFLDENTGDENLRTIYLKLLLSCLHRKRLSGIFARDPHCYELLEEHPPDIDRRTSSKVSSAAPAMAEDANAKADPDCELTTAQYRGIGAKLPSTVSPSPGQLPEYDKCATHEEMSKTHSSRGRMRTPQFDYGSEDAICGGNFVGVANRDPKHRKGVVEGRTRRQELVPACQGPSQTAEGMEEADFSFHIFQDAGEMDYDLYDEAPAELVYPDNREHTVSRPADSSIHPPHEVTRAPPRGSRGTCPNHGPTLLPSSRLQPVANLLFQNQEQAFFDPFRGRREATVTEHIQQPQFPPQGGARRKYHHHSTLLPSPRLQLVVSPPSQNQEQEFFNPFRGRREVTVPEHIKQQQKGTPRKYRLHSTLLPSPRLQPVAGLPSENQEHEFFNPFRGRREVPVVEQQQFPLQETTRGKYHHHSILLPSPRLQPIVSPPSQNQEQEFFNPFRGQRTRQPQKGTPRKHHPPSTFLPSPRLQSVAGPPSENQEQEFFNPFRGRREVPVLEHIEQPQFPLYEETPKKNHCRNRRRIRAGLQPRKLFMNESEVAPEESSPEPCVVSYKEESFTKKKWKSKHGPWGPCATDEDNECSPQTMQAEQEAMLAKTTKLLDGTPIHHSPEMYKLPESMSPHIREGCMLSKRLVDEMMLLEEDDQTDDDEIFEGCDSPCSSPTSSQTQKQRRLADQTLDEVITRHHGRPGRATQAVPRQIVSIEERARARERLRERNQQDPKLEEGRCPFARNSPASASRRGTQSPSGTVEHAAVSAQKSTARRNVKKTLSYKKTWF